MAVEKSQWDVPFTPSKSPFAYTFMSIDVTGIIDIRHAPSGTLVESFKLPDGWPVCRDSPSVIFAPPWIVLRIGQASQAVFDIEEPVWRYPIIAALNLHDPDRQVFPLCKMKGSVNWTRRVKVTKNCIRLYTMPDEYFFDYSKADTLPEIKRVALGSPAFVYGIIPVEDKYKRFRMTTLPAVVTFATDAENIVALPTYERENYIISSDRTHIKIVIIRTLQENLVHNITMALVPPFASAPRLLVAENGFVVHTLPGEPDKLVIADYEPAIHLTLNKPMTSEWRFFFLDVNRITIAPKTLRVVLESDSLTVHVNRQGDVLLQGYFNMYRYHILCRRSGTYDLYNELTEEPYFKLMSTPHLMNTMDVALAPDGMWVTARNTVRRFVYTTKPDTIHPMQPGQPLPPLLDSIKMAEDIDYTVFASRPLTAFALEEFVMYDVLDSMSIAVFTPSLAEHIKRFDYSATLYEKENVQP